MSEAAAVLGEAKDAVLAQRAHIQELEAALLAVRDAAFVGDIKRVRAITNDALRRGMLS